MLKSINIKLDINDVERISHFRPTSKSISLIEKLFSSKYSLMISAPYGSGKSIVSAFMLYLIENKNESKKTIGDINNKIKKINIDLHEKISNRLKSQDQGLVIPLYGYIENIEQNIIDSLLTSIDRINLSIPSEIKDKFKNINKDNKFFENLSNELKELKPYIDHLLIIWDEFGAHLEGLIENKQTKDLTKVQDLAALVSRIYSSFGYPAHIYCLQHQSMATYTESQPNQIRQEWAKVAGRFDTIEFIDDSREIISLLSDIYEQTIKNKNTFKLIPSSIKPYLERLYQSSSHLPINLDELTQLTQQTKHLTPLTLVLLPRVSARLAQNERTLFDYLNNITPKEYDQELGLDHMYDYFVPLMKSDKSIGGTYRLYLLTVNTLKNASNEIDIVIIKTASLLSYAMAGHQTKISKSLLELAVMGVTRFKIRAVRAAIQELIDKKLLLHRVYTDEIGLWQGSNIDLKDKIKHETHEIAQSFNFIEFLRNNFPIGYTTPTIYNFEKSINRYIKNEYLSYQNVKFIESSVKELLDDRSDCLVLYLINTSEISDETIDKLKNILLHLDFRIVLALPTIETQFIKAAQEYTAIKKIKSNTSLINQDPVVLDELNEIEKDIYQYLLNQSQKTFSLSSPVLFLTPLLENTSKTIKTYTIKSTTEYQNLFYQYFMNIYSKTPIINNEVLNRTKVSAASINNRKKLISSLLEHSDLSNLGFDAGHEGGQTSSLQSLYRTLLIKPKLYAKYNEYWRFSELDELPDAEFREFIGVFKDFFQTHTKDNEIKPISQLLSILQNPPFGIRQGLIPVYFAATFKAYGKFAIILQDGLYLEDIKPSDIEQIFKTPENYHIRVLEISNHSEKYLSSIIKIFAPNNIKQGPRLLLKEAYDAIILWYQALLDGPKTTKHISSDHKKLRSIIKRVKNPYELLFLNIPDWANLTYDDDKIILMLNNFKHELESVESNYLKIASDYLTELIKLDDTTENTWLSSFNQWSNSFPIDWVNELDQVQAKILLNTTRRKFETQFTLMNALTAAVFNLMIKRWTDVDVDRFKMEIRGLVDYIESQALDKSMSRDINNNSLPIFRSLIETRLKKYIDAYINLTSSEEFENLIKTIKK